MRVSVFLSISHLFDLALVVYTSPGAPLKWSLWDRLNIEGVGMTLQHLLTHIEDTYGLTVSMMSYGPAIIYSFFGNKKEMQVRLGMPLAGGPILRGARQSVQQARPVA